MQYAVVAAAFVAVVAADGWENIKPTTTPAPVYTTTPAPVYTTPVTTPAAPSWSEWEEQVVSSIPVEESTKKPAVSTSWAVWSTATTPAPVYTTTSTVPKYTGAANKANMVGAGAVGLAAVAFML